MKCVHLRRPIRTRLLFIAISDLRLFGWRQTVALYNCGLFHDLAGGFPHPCRLKSWLGEPPQCEERRYKCERREEIFQGSEHNRISAGNSGFARVKRE